MNEWMNGVKSNDKITFEFFFLAKDFIINALIGSLISVE